MKMFKFVVDAYERNAASLLQCSSNTGLNEYRSFRKQDSKRSNPDSQITSSEDKEELSPRKRFFPNLEEDVDSQSILICYIID